MPRRILTDPNGDVADRQAPGVGAGLGESQAVTALASKASAKLHCQGSPHAMRAAIISDFVLASAIEHFRCEPIDMRVAADIPDKLALVEIAR